MSHKRKPRVLAVASGGGHWVQLRRVAPAFDGCDVTYLTVEKSYRDEVNDATVKIVLDATRWNKLKLMIMMIQIIWIVLVTRPDVVVSTGAAPGYVALRVAGMLGKRTVWIDSIANVEEVSMSGRKIGPHATLWLTQWSHLANPEGPDYRGAVL
jgi:UDP-N-acetylglucosamine:LPS N-acetylglucosamine transferase